MVVDTAATTQNTYFVSFENDPSPRALLIVFRQLVSAYELIPAPAVAAFYGMTCGHGGQRRHALAGHHPERRTRSPDPCELLLRGRQRAEHESPSHFSAPAQFQVRPQQTILETKLEKRLSQRPLHFFGSSPLARGRRVGVFTLQSWSGFLQARSLDIPLDR